MATTTDPTTTRQLGPVAEGNLQQLEACVSRSQVDNVLADANRKALVELARYFEVYDGNSRALKEQLVPMVADAYWSVRTPSLPEQADATLASIDAVLAEAPVQGPELPELPEAPEAPEAAIVVPSLVELVNQGMTAQEAATARKALQGGAPKAKGTPRPRAAWVGRYAEAKAIQASLPKGKRGPGTKADDTTLADSMRRSLAEAPGMPEGQARKVAYYVDNLAFSGARWSRVWAEVAEAEAQPTA